jgi:hypothetical protein
MSFNVARWGRGAASLLAKGDAPLDLPTIGRYIPAVFAETAHDSRSGRFVPVPTYILLEALAKEGFQPFRVDLAGTGDHDKRAFTRHMLRLRHVSTVAVRPDFGRIVPEIVITNANDGTGAYTIELGLFRFICLNGLMAGSVYASVRVLHVGASHAVRDKVIEGTYSVIKDAPAIMASVGDMASTVMPADARLAYASDALALRWPEQAPIDAPRLLTARRTGETDSVWSTFNVIQENLMQGGMRQGTGARWTRRKVRPLRSIADDTRVNRALWSEATAWRAALAA